MFKDIPHFFQWTIQLLLFVKWHDWTVPTFYPAVEFSSFLSYPDGSFERQSLTGSEFQKEIFDA